MYTLFTERSEEVISTEKTGEGLCESLIWYGQR